MLTLTGSTADVERMLADVENRVNDLTAGWGPMVDDTILKRQRDFWMTRGNGSWDQVKDSTRARDRRGGRDEDPMVSKGDLRAAATRKGAPGQRITRRSKSLLFAVTDPKAVHLARGGRGSVFEPRQEDADHLGAQAIDYFLTGRA